MTDRIVDISECAATLSVRHSQLVIRPEGGAEVSTPIADLSVLVISHPQVLITQAVISRLAETGGSVVICGEKCSPTAMMLPLHNHSTQAERFTKQAQASLPLRKRLWRQIVKAKVAAQARLLRELHGSDAGLQEMVRRVRPGDTTFIESQAARTYWRALFADTSFRRGRERSDQNRHLDYGYAVLRAMVTRAICAAGLHPSFGLQHHNRYDPFCLASDLMEPFRPIIDRAVYRWIQDHDPALPLDKQAKAFLVNAVVARYEFEGESRTMFDLLTRAASSLARTLMGDATELEIPEI